MAKPFSRIRSAAVDGRLHNPYYRKVQLKRLHDKLVDSSAEIRTAISEDTGHQPAEALAEYWLALQCLADCYRSIDPERDLADEYRVARGQSWASAREPVGIVLIEPATHTFLFSLISALAPAIEGGNCVIVRREQTLLKTPQIVLGILEQSLDQDIIEVTSARSVADGDINHRHVRVLQNGSSQPHLANHLVSSPDARVVAVVERDANLRAAAELLVGARFGLRGQSPYAPDLVLVNEWVVADFLAAVAEFSERVVASSSNDPAPVSGSGTTDRFGERMKAQGHARVVFTKSQCLVLEVTDRASVRALPKLRERCLVVHAVTSMEDAIDVSNAQGRLAAAFVFTANPRAAKYMCQFLDAATSFVNQLPTSLLFHPIAPERVVVDVSRPSLYNRSLFTLPKPQYTESSARSQTLHGALTGRSPSQVARLEAEAVARLPDVKRLKDKPDIGFFDQGIITGGVLVLSALVSCGGLLAYYTRTRLQVLY
ncbi:hypothetical protein VTK73DRAFT_7130 [Phialemonium thermophilum]|uniref:Aldehyde dehydrogenase domain-containing protein n=1 Tax=Phialemonium thermophilum TaxID=223376 RepID=A0ABR3WG68_9PEZI